MKLRTNVAMSREIENLSPVLYPIFDTAEAMGDDKCIVVTGNVVDGFVFYGPFEYENAAIDWAEGPGGLSCDWTIAVINHPWEA